MYDPLWEPGPNDEPLSRESLSRKLDALCEVLSQRPYLSMWEGACDLQVLQALQELAAKSIR